MKKRKLEDSEVEEIKELIYTYYFSSAGNTVYLYDIEFQITRELEFDYKAPSETATIITGNTFYLIGGDLDHKAIAATYSVQITRKEHSPAVKLADLNVARCGIGLEKHNNFIYAIGGCMFADKWKSLANCEKYDIGNNKWIVIPSLNEVKAYVCVCKLDQWIYAIGGYMYPSGSRLTKFERFSLLKENSWEVLTGTQSDWIPRRGCGGIAIDNKRILIFGGISKPPDYSSVYLLTESKEFEVKKLDEKMEEKGGHWNHQKNVVIYKDVVYAVSYDSTIHKYDVKDGKWSCILKSQWRE